MLSVTPMLEAEALAMNLLDQILAQKEAYVDLCVCSCQIGDAYIDLSIHLIDTYTRSRVNAAPPFNPIPTPRDDRTQNPPNRTLFQTSSFNCIK